MLHLDRITAWGHFNPLEHIAQPILHISELWAVFPPTPGTKTVNHQAAAAAAAAAQLRKHDPHNIGDRQLLELFLQ